MKSYCDTRAFARRASRIQTLPKDFFSLAKPQGSKRWRSTRFKWNLTRLTMDGTEWQCSSTHQCDCRLTCTKLSSLRNYREAAADNSYREIPLTVLCSKSPFPELATTATRSLTDLLQSGSSHLCYSSHVAITRHEQVSFGSVVFSPPPPFLFFSSSSFLFFFSSSGVSILVAPIDVHFLILFCFNIFWLVRGRAGWLPLMPARSFAGPCE